MSSDDPNSRRSSRPLWRGRRLPPDYTQRGTRLKLFLLVAMLMLVLAAIERARDPDSWRMLEMLSQNSAKTEPPHDNRLPPKLPPAAGPSVDTFVAQGGAAPLEIQPLGAADDAVEDAWNQAWRQVFERLAPEQRGLLFAALRAGLGRESGTAQQPQSNAELLAALGLRWEDHQSEAFLSLASLEGDDRSRWVDVLRQINERYERELQPALATALAGSEPSEPQQKSLAEFEQTLVAIARQRIVDDTVFRPAEREIWFHELARVRDLATESRKSRPESGAEAVAYLQLFEQPAAYRGRMVTVRGTVRLAYRMAAPANDLGIPEYYVFWLHPAGGPDSPIVIYALQPPPGFPPIALRDAGGGTRLREDLSVTGVSFKRWAYLSQGATRTAPLIVTNQPVWEPTPELAAGGNALPISWQQLAAGAAMGLVVAAALGAVLYRWGRRRRDVETSRLPHDFSGLAVVAFALALAQAGGSALAQEDPATRTALGPPASPLELLERFDLGPARLAVFSSGQPMRPEEEETLLRLLYQLPRIGLEHVARWRKAGAAWSEIAGTPGDHRGELFALRGRVKRVEAMPLAPPQADALEFARYFRVALALDDSPQEALIFARHVPAAWKPNVELDEPAAADGLFLKVGEASAEAEAAPPPLWFAAARVAWLPDRVDPVNQIGASQVALAKLGVDMGLWDDVRLAQNEPLGKHDREAFYQILAALGQAAAGDLGTGQPAALDPIRLLPAPAEHCGEQFRVEGQTQRVVKVAVEDADIRARFGLDHYYEIDLFVPLGETGVRLGDDASGERNPVYANYFPATLIVRSLPPDLPAGERVRETIRADAVFFKVWTYDSEYTDRFGKLQPALLLLAREPVVVRLEESPNNLVSGLVTASLVLALGTVVVVWWWYGRADKRLTRLGQDQPPPDFSHLRR